MTISIPGSTKVSATNPDNVTFELFTGPDVYQPLLETTMAVDVFFKPYEDLGKPSGFKVADFGAGTGALGIMVKKTYPQLDVALYDNDPNAEKYMLANAELHNVDVETNIMDVADISGVEFDAIISSPPYIPIILKKLANVGTHMEDPDNTVFGGYKGLEVADVFITKAAEVLKTGGYLVEVHSHAQTEDIHTLLENNGFSNIVTSRLNVPTDLDLLDAVFTIAYKN